MTDTIDTSKWPKPGETWRDGRDETHGPLQLAKTGMLTNGRDMWAPSGSWHLYGGGSARDLISKVEPTPEPVEFWVNEYEASSKSLLALVERQSVYDTLQAAVENAAARSVRHHRVRIEVLETVDAKP